jgi:hypothetical protein
VILLARRGMRSAAALDGDLASVLRRAVEWHRGALPAPAGTIELHSPEAHRSAVSAWVNLDSASAMIEIRLRAYCTHHDPPSASSCTAPDEGVHDMPHPVQGCTCWCSGVASTLMQQAAVVPVVPGLDLAVAHLTRFSSEHPASPASRACTWLAAASATTYAGFGLFCALVADGESPARALAAARALR